MAEATKSKEDAERKEALRVDRQSVPTTGQTSYISPDLSFTEGHGDPEEWPEEDKERDAKTITTEGWVVEPLTREENIEKREKEVDEAIKSEKKFAEENAKIREKEAEEDAETRKAQKVLTGALTEVMSGAVQVKRPSRSESKSDS